MPRKQSKSLFEESVEAWANYWGNCCPDCGPEEYDLMAEDAIKRIRDLEQQLAALSWQKITPENLPKVGDELIGKDEPLPCPATHLWDSAEQWIRFGWTHFRPIGAPNAKER